MKKKKLLLIISFLILFFLFSANSFAIECSICNYGEEKRKGNSDCNSRVNTLDFSYWKSVFRGEADNYADVDFNCQTGYRKHYVNYADLDVWVNNFQTRRPFQEWKFSILGDTQSHNEVFYNDLSNAMARHDTRMMIHLGDYTFAERGDSLINKVILRKRGMAEDKYGLPIEFHGVNGNHGSGYNKAMNDLSRNIICLGRFEEQVNPLMINGRANYGVPQTNEPLNPVVQNLYSYCVPEGYYDPDNIQLTFPKESKFFQQYSFIRGGIKFIITGYDVIQNQERREWVKSEICKPENSSVTIIYTHNPPAWHYQDGYDSNSIRFWNQLIDNLDCENNFKVIVGGHVHRFDKLEHSGVTYITVSGMFYGEIAPGHDLWQKGLPLSDYWIASVSKNKVDFRRYVWDGNSFVDNGVILTIPGEFSNYRYGKEF